MTFHFRFQLAIQEWTPVLPARALHSFLYLVVFTAVANQRVRCQDSFSRRSNGLRTSVRCLKNLEQWRELRVLPGREFSKTWSLFAPESTAEPPASWGGNACKHVDLVIWNLYMFPRVSCAAGLGFTMDIYCK
jgi:hypothetical protein